MVYTEYFARGTEPNAFCPLHGGILVNTVATSGDAADATPLPVDRQRNTVTSTADSPPLPPSPESAAEKKRGFWGRIFRR
jgi:hypothetical protein